MNGKCEKKTQLGTDLIVEVQRKHSATSDVGIPHKKNSDVGWAGHFLLLDMASFLFLYFSKTFFTEIYFQFHKL